MNGFSRLMAALVMSAAPLSAPANDASSMREDQLFGAVLANPDDAGANIAYARHAEATGLLRSALSAYERASRADPSNVEAKLGFIRVRRLLSPNSTRVRVAVGAGYSADARRIDRPFSSLADGAFVADIDIEDERTIGDFRVRTLASGTGALQTRFEDLSQFRAGGWTGPVFDLTPETTLHVAVGGAVDWLAHRAVFGEASFRAEIGTLLHGVRQRLAVTLGQREAFDPEPGFGDSFFFEVAGLYTLPDLALAGDAFYVQPSLRHTGAGALRSGEAGSEYWEYGARFTYFAPLSDVLTDIGFSLGFYQRDFNEDVADGGETRRDFVLEPGVQLLFRDFFSENVDLTADYWFERNFSNDDDDFENHVLGARLVWRF